MEPVDRARLWLDELPTLEWQGTSAIWSRFPLRLRSSSSDAKSIPAARRTAMPSSRIILPSAPPRASGPQRASRAFDKFMRSLAYFHRMMSERTTESIDEELKAAEIVSAVSS